ncbi:hypothetical protein RT99_05895 [Flavobacterium sp. MEB061]|uniref:hypothetical protein n=1 Tax=Flavobacterium sp. MEB061 TaxID=1587524 RepID=UPI0005AC1E93|nr:hypothetical protein [Flavobacterium sp. MEB061]KIQ22639.1 hypothetical protein RT99_05895 [Flavobacterium sp. MEB061]
MKKVLLIISFLILFSCGRRQSETYKTEEITKLEASGIIRNSGNSQEILSQESNLKQNSISRINEESDFCTEENTFEPVDPRFPASVIDSNGKETQLNNAKMTNKKSHGKNKTNSENSQNSEKTIKTDLQKNTEQEEKADIKIKAAEKKKGATKKTIREPWSLLNLFWLLIPIGLIIIILWIRKKKKQLNPLS